jgi:hypothetical protein
MIEQFNKVTDEEISTNGVSALSDRPNSISRYGQGGLSADQLKAWFDKLARLIAEKFNAMCDTLCSGDASKHIGIKLGDYKSLYDLIEGIQNGSLASYLTVSEKSLTETARGFNEDIQEAFEALERNNGVTSELRTDVDAVVSDIDISLDTSEYKLTIATKDRLGRTISTDTIDFPLESVVVNGRYDQGYIFLTLRNGNEINIPLTNIVNGLVGSAEFYDKVDALYTTISRVETSCKEYTNSASEAIRKNVEQTAGEITSVNNALTNAVKEQEATNKVVSSRLNSLDKAVFGAVYSTVEDLSAAYVKGVPLGAQTHALLESVATCVLNDSVDVDMPIFSAADSAFVSNGVFSLNGTYASGEVIAFAEKSAQTPTGQVAVGFDVLKGSCEGEAYIDLMYTNEDAGMDLYCLRIPIPEEAGFTKIWVEAYEVGVAPTYARIYCSQDTSFNDMEFRLYVGHDVTKASYDTKLDKIVSTRKNLLPREALNLNNWGDYTPPSGNKRKKFALDLPDGWYVMRCNREVLEGRYLFLYHSTNGGEATSAKCDTVFNATGYNASGHFITNNEGNVNPIWFKVDGTVRYELGLIGGNISDISEWQIERLPDNEFSPTNAPGVVAKPTKYEEYDPRIYEIPDEIKNLDGYGVGLNDRYYNSIDFSLGLYTQYVAKRDYEEGDYNSDTMHTDYDKTTYLLASPRVVSIGQFLPSLKGGDLLVTGGGVIRFESKDIEDKEVKMPIKSSVYFQVK